MNDLSHADGSARAEPSGRKRPRRRDSGPAQGGQPHERQAGPGGGVGPDQTRMRAGATARSARSSGRNRADFHVRFAQRGEGPLAVDERASTIEETATAAVEQPDGAGTGTLRLELPHLLCSGPARPTSLIFLLCLQSADLLLGLPQLLGEQVPLVGSGRLRPDGGRCGTSGVDEETGR